MSTRAHFRLRTLIIGGAIIGAFVLGMAFEHLKPWHKKYEEPSVERVVARSVLPTALNKCIMLSIEATSNHDARKTYSMACMESKGYRPTFNEHSCDFLKDTYDPEASDCWELP